MDSSGVNFQPIQPGHVPPPTGKEGPSGRDVEAMLFAALLAMMGVNSSLIRNYYMKKVLEGEKFVKAGTGIQGPLNGDPGSITNQQWDAFANGWEFFEKAVANWKAYKKTHPNAKTPLPIQQMEKVLANKGLQKLFKDLKALQAAENQKPIDIAKVERLKKAVTNQLKDIQFPKTPAGKRAFQELQATLNAYVQGVSAPETVLGKEALMLINNIGNLAKYASSMLKRFEGVAELINRLILS